MPTEKFGIENLKKVMAFGVAIGKEVATDLTDSKLTFLEVIQLATQLAGIGELVKNKEAIIEEAKDLTIAEIEELVTGVGDAINNEKVTAVIEHALGVIVSVAALIQDFKKEATPETPETPE